jgi:putative addiction module killer protein
MQTYGIVQYTDETGKGPFEEWLSRLERGAAAKVYTALSRMEAGNFSDSKLLQGGLWERRIHSGPGYRIYYALYTRRVIVLLGGRTKATQTADIRKARTSWYEFKSRAAGSYSPPH